MTDAPLCLMFPKKPEVPPPNLDIIPTSDWVYKILPISSEILDPKQLIGRPLFLPKFDQTGDANEKNP